MLYSDYIQRNSFSFLNPFVRFLPFWRPNNSNKYLHSILWNKKCFILYYYFSALTFKTFKQWYSDINQCIFTEIHYASSQQRSEYRIGLKNQLFHLLQLSAWRYWCHVLSRAVLTHESFKTAIAYSTIYLSTIHKKRPIILAPTLCIGSRNIILAAMWRPDRKNNARPQDKLSCLIDCRTILYKSGFGDRCLSRLCWIDN